MSDIKSEGFLTRFRIKTTYLADDVDLGAHHQQEFQAFEMLFCSEKRRKHQGRQSSLGKVEKSGKGSSRQGKSKEA